MEGRHICNLSKETFYDGEKFILFLLIKSPYSEDRTTFTEPDSLYQLASFPLELVYSSNGVVPVNSESPSIQSIESYFQLDIEEILSFVMDFGEYSISDFSNQLRNKLDNELEILEILNILVHIHPLVISMSSYNKVRRYFLQGESIVYVNGTNFSSNILENVSEETSYILNNLSSPNDSDGNLIFNDIFRRTFINYEDIYDESVNVFWLLYRNLVFYNVDEFRLSFHDLIMLKSAYAHMLEYFVPSMLEPTYEGQSVLNKNFKKKLLKEF